MARHTLIPLDAPGEWRDALTGIAHNFGHTWENCHAVALTTRLPTYLWHLECEGVRVVCPFFERSWQGHVDIAKPFGFSGFVGTSTCPDLARLWRDFARERGYVCGYLGLDPIFQAPGRFDASEVSQYDSVHVIDLSASDEEMWSRLSHNRQYDFRNWQGTSSRIVTARKELAPFFVEQYRPYVERKGAQSHYLFERDTLEFLCGLDNVLMAGIGTTGEISAVMLFVHTAHMSEALLTAYLPGSPSFTGELIWFGAHALKKAGAKAMNVGGGSAGIHEFKRSLGCIERPLHCLRQVYDADKYRRLCAAQGISDSSGGYFPAYRQTR